MARYTPTNITTGHGSTSLLNKNFADLEIAIDSLLSREGDTPNSMSADVDMNSNDLLNTSTLYAEALTLKGKSIVATGDITQGGIASDYYTLGAAQTVVPLIRTLYNASLYVDGTSGDRGRLFEGASYDYTVSADGNTVTLTSAFTAGTRLVVVFNELDAPLAGVFLAAANKAQALGLSPVARQALFVHGTDGGLFKAVTGAAAATYSDDGGSYCGTVFIPTSGDGSAAWQRVYTGGVLVEWFGASADGTTDDTAASDLALASFDHVTYSEENTYALATVEIASNKDVEVNGTCLMLASSAAGTNIFENADLVGGNSGIRIFGTGTIDGNKASQSGTTDAVWHTLVRIDNSDDIEFSVANVKGNYFPTATPSDKTTAAVYISNSTNVRVHDSIGKDYGRECFWLQLCNYSELYNIHTEGGTDSWSGAQFSGDYNKSFNISTKDAGASSVSFDCRYSSLRGVTVDDTSFFHGINFGHAGIPADGSAASDLVVNGAADKGINVGSGTVGLKLSAFYVSGSGGHGVNASDSSNDITITNGKSTGNAGDGVRVFSGAGVTSSNFKLGDVDLTGNTGYGLGMQGCTVDVSTADLSGNTAGTITRLSSAVENFTDVRAHATDALAGGVSIASHTPGVGTTITNANAFSNSKIAIEPSNSAASACSPYIRVKSDGSFVIDSVTTPGGGAFIRWQII